MDNARHFSISFFCILVAAFLFSFYFLNLASLCYVAGNYGPEPLLEMMALHLESVSRDCRIWREFALCFLKVSQYAEDCMSVCLHGNAGGKMQDYSARCKRIPKLFIHAKSGRAWRFRCRWWLTLHFSKNLLASEIAAGMIAYISLLSLPLSKFRKCFLRNLA